MILHTTTARLQCHERKKSYYDLILKQKHAYILQFQAFFSTTNFPKKIVSCIFCPPNMKNKKTSLCFITTLSRRFWKSFYVIILKSLCLNLLKEFQRTKRVLCKLSKCIYENKNSVILLLNFCIWKNIITYWIKVAFGWIKYQITFLLLSKRSST